MWRLAVGIGLVVLGVACFVVGLQYASFSVPLSAEDPLHTRYQTFSAIFGYTSYAIMAVGVATSVWAVRRQSKDDKARRGGS